MRDLEAKTTGNMGGTSKAAGISEKTEGTRVTNKIPTPKDPILLTGSEGAQGERLMVARRAEGPAVAGTTHPNSVITERTVVGRVEL